MENLYLTQVVDGQTQLHKVDFSQVIDPEVLTPTTIVQRPVDFIYDNRKFRHSVYADAGMITQVIECDTLFWQMPIYFNDRRKEFQVSDDESSNAQKRIGIENCILIIHAGDNTSESMNMYISNRELTVPQVTNIYDDGRMCIDAKFDACEHPANIINLIEASPGNNHLLVCRESGISDRRDSIIPLYFKNDITYALPYSKRPLHHAKTKYIKLQDKYR